MQAPYRHDLCRPNLAHNTANSQGSSQEVPSLNMNLLAEALDKHPDLRDALVLALNELAAAADSKANDSRANDRKAQEDNLKKNNKEG